MFSFGDHGMEVFADLLQAGPFAWLTISTGHRTQACSWTRLLFRMLGRTAPESACAFQSVRIEEQAPGEYCDSGIDGDRPEGRRRGASSLRPRSKESDQEPAARLVDQARAEGVELVGENELLDRLTKPTLESVLEGEITDHLGYDKHARGGREMNNNRNGARSKTVITYVGPVEITVPRDRDTSFEPKIVRKWQRYSNASRRRSGKHP